MAGWTIQRVWARLGWRTDHIDADSKLVRAPWELENDDKLILTSALPPLTREPRQIASVETFVFGLRTARLTARADGKYTMRYENGDHGEITCGVDLPDLANRLAQLVERCHTAGEHDLRAMMPGCPDNIFLEWFGQNYNCETGIYHAH